MKVLVTGAAGHLGSVLRTRLMSEPRWEPVFAIGMRTPGRHDDHRIDLTDTAAIDHLVRGVRPDAVVHLAAIVGGECEVDATRARAVNVDATRELARIAGLVGASRFVFASTSAVYGDSYGAPAKEEGPIVLANAYARSKFEAEQELSRVATTASGLSAVSLRIFNMFGRNFTDSLIYRLAHSQANNPVILHGLDTFSRDYVHVDDVISAIIAALTTEPAQPHIAINIGGGSAVSNRDLLTVLSQQGDVHYRLKNNTYSYSCADLTRARRILHYSAAHRF